MMVCLRSNKSVNTDAHGRPRPSVAPSRVRRLRLRYAASLRLWFSASGFVSL
jgi:hypothetical protein